MNFHAGTAAGIAEPGIVAIGPLLAVPAAKAGPVVFGIPEEFAGFMLDLALLHHFSV